jgi:hypothetical protein
MTFSLKRSQEFSLAVRLANFAQDLRSERAENTSYDMAE